MKTIKQLFFFSLLGMLFVFSSCEDENDTSQSNNQASNMINVAVPGVVIGVPETKGTDVPDTVIIEDPHGMQIKAVLKRNTPITRSTTPLGSTKKFRVIAYKQGDISSTGYVSHGDFTVGASVDTVAGFRVPGGATYTFVCYSFNSSSTLPAFSSTDTEVTGIDPTDTGTGNGDLLYTKFDATITTNDQALNIEFKHMFPFVRVVTNTTNNNTAAGHAVIGIDAITTTFSSTYTSATMQLDDGTLSATGSTSDLGIVWGTIKNTTSTSVAYKDTSNTFLVFTNKATTNTLKIPSITYSGYEIYDYNKSITFTKTLTGGYLYDLQLTFKPLIWANGNLIYNGGGSYSFQSPQSATSGVVDGGDYFCWNRLYPINTYGNASDTTSNAKTNYSDDYDPCQQIASPDGLSVWRTPTSYEAYFLTSMRHYVFGSYGGVDGVYFGTTSVPSTANRDNYLFLPYTGQINHESTSVNVGTEGRYLIGKDVNGSGWQFFWFNPTDLHDKIQNGTLLGNSAVPIRCVTYGYSN